MSDEICGQSTTKILEQETAFRVDASSRTYILSAAEERRQLLATALRDSVRHAGPPPGASTGQLERGCSGGPRLGLGSAEIRSSEFSSAVLRHALRHGKGVANTLLQYKNSAWRKISIVQNLRCFMPLMYKQKTVEILLVHFRSLFYFSFPSHPPIQFFRSGRLPLTNLRVNSVWLLRLGTNSVIMVCL